MRYNDALGIASLLNSIGIYKDEGEHSPNDAARWHFTTPDLKVGSGSSRGSESRQRMSAKTGSHSGSITVIPVKEIGILIK